MSLQREPEIASLVRVGRPQRAAASRALGRAFADYVLMTYAEADARRRHPAVATLYAAILRDCGRFGEVYTTRDGAGVACWLPPGVAAPGLARQLWAGMLPLTWRFGSEALARLTAYDRASRQLHHEFAHDPHWYLSAIGVVPERQGQGLGSMLLAPLLARADVERMPAYLETHREENVRLYARHGFVVMREVRLPEHAVPLFGMRREPRG